VERTKNPGAGIGYVNDPRSRLKEFTGGPEAVRPGVYRLVNMLDGGLEDGGVDIA